MDSIQLLGALRTEGFGALRLRAASAAAERIMCSRDCDGPSGAAGVTRWRRLCRSSTERFYVSCNNNSLLFLQLRRFLLKLLPATAEHFHLDHQLLLLLVGSVQNDFLSTEKEVSISTSFLLQSAGLPIGR